MQVFFLLLIITTLLQLANALENNQYIMSTVLEYSGKVIVLIALPSTNSSGSHHELCVSFGQSVSYKPNRLEMFDYGMKEPGLKREIIGIK